MQPILDNILMLLLNYLFYHLKFQDNKLSQQMAQGYEVVLPELQKEGYQNNLYRLICQLLF